MQGLRELKNRIGSVRSTRKITAAMKVVAASKLRRAEDQVRALQLYAERLERFMVTATNGLADGGASISPFFSTRVGVDKPVRLVLVTTDRGLCGGLNPSLVRETRRRMAELEGGGDDVELYCIGRKGHDVLKRDHYDRIVGSRDGLSRPRPQYAEAVEIADVLIQDFLAGSYRSCWIIYPRFVSALTQTPLFRPLFPVLVTEASSASDDKQASQAVCELEPDEEELLAELLPVYFRVRMFLALVQGFASEQGARVSAMDNATRNAGEVIDRLTLEYNRSRQAAITSELIEIISGAEAL